VNSIKEILMKDSVKLGYDDNKLTRNDSDPKIRHDTI